MRARSITLLVATAALALPATARGQCTTHDFEDFAPGTVITDQYPGVEFSVIGGTGCVTHVEVLEPDTGCSSPNRALKVDEADSGCDTHEQYLKMVFDPPARSVSFAVGPGWDDPFHDYRIVAYRTEIGPGQIDSVDLIDVHPGVRNSVTMYADGADLIRRIHVIGMILPGTNLVGRECIDDLQIESDQTPPEVDITSPSFGACICVDPTPAAKDLFLVGTSCEPDGLFDKDVLEYRPVGGSSWYFIADAHGPLCSSGPLYSVDLDLLEHIEHGWFEFRVTTYNECGMTASDSVTVYIDLEFGTAQITQPVPSETVCGMVDIVGTAWAKCFDYYRVDFKPQSGGAWMPVDPSQLTYEVAKAHDCMLAMWNTNMVSDDIYGVRLRGYDGCGNVDSEIVFVTVDNSGPCGCSADVNGDGEVNVDDLVMVILTWGPCLP